MEIFLFGDPIICKESQYPEYNLHGIVLGRNTGFYNIVSVEAECFKMEWGKLAPQCKRNWSFPRNCKNFIVFNKVVALQWKLGQGIF